MFMKKTGVQIAAATVVALALAACGGGGGGGDAPVASNPPPAAGGGTGTGGGTTNPPPVQTVAVGTNWEARLSPDVWHSLSTNEDGSVLVAGEAALGPATATSYLNTSRDGGATWTEFQNGGVWIASDVSRTGTRIAAVQYGGGMFISNDSGVSFSQVVAANVPTGNVPYEGVTVSLDGNVIAAVIQTGPLIISRDGGVTWNVAAGAPTSTGWRAIDSNGDGSVIVAVAEDGAVYRSVAGAAFAEIPVTVGGTAVTDQNWYRVKVSENGQTIAIAGNSFGAGSGAAFPASYGDGVYVSRDGGATFTLDSNVVGEYSALGMSYDGQVIGATISNPNNDPGTPSGQILVSANGGAFAPVTITGATDRDWRAMAIAGNATRYAVAAGRFLGNAAGQLYTSSGARP